MKKQIIMLLLTIGMMGTVAAQKKGEIKLRLPEGDIVEILRTIKQDMVYDTLDVQARIDAVQSCEKAIKNIRGKDGDKANIIIPDRYVAKWMQRSSYDFEQYEQLKKGHDRFLRVAAEVQAQDANLKLLKDDFSLQFVRKRLLRELKTKDPKEYENENKIYREDELDKNGDVK